MSEVAKDYPTTESESVNVADWHKEGVRIVILSISGRHFCAYLGVPIDHPLAGLDYDSIPLQCHGGLTFGGKLKDIDTHYFYGWDYAHSGDKVYWPDELNIPDFGEDGREWTLEEVKQEAEYVLYDFLKLCKLAEQIATPKAEDKEDL